MENRRSYRGRDPRSLEMIEVEVESGCVISVRSLPGADSDLWITPGLVDLQVNGYGGVDLNSVDCDTASIVRLVKMLAALGTTTFVPTVITASKQATKARLRTIAQARAESATVAHTAPGIHLEGPNISPLEGYRGAHAREEVRPPSLTEFEELQDAAEGLIKLVTLSPHWPGATAYIGALRNRGVVVALGHTHASREQIEDAINAGAQLSTHLGNGIATELHRHNNPLWPQLADAGLTATVIADGLHLPDDLLQVVLQSKGFEHTVLVSDAVALAGSPPGHYSSPIGGEVTVGEDGAIRMRGSGLLAGSGIALKDAVAHIAALPGCALADAVQMATVNPADRLDLKRGAIRVGISADLLLFRWQPGDSTLQVVDVLVQGRSVAES